MEADAGAPAEVVAMAHRPAIGLTHAAVRAAIAAELRRLHADVLKAPITDEMAELLRRLDQVAEDGDHGCQA